MSKFKVGDKVVTRNGYFGTVVSVTGVNVFQNVQQPIEVKLDRFSELQSYSPDGSFRPDFETNMDITKLTKLDRLLYEI